MYDIIIIGAGPAGVSATLYARARGASVALIEKNRVGGLVGNVSKVSHYTGILLDETGDSFAARLADQVQASGCTYINGKVESADLSGEIKRLQLNTGEVVEGKAVIIATGHGPKPLGLTNEKELGVSYISRDLVNQVKDCEVFVAGGSDGAVKEALFLSAHAKHVHVVQIQDRILTVDEFRQQLDATDNITVHLSSEITAIDGSEGQINRLTIRGPEGERVFEGNPLYLFAYIGQIPDLSFVNDALSLEGGYILADQGATSLTGVFAAGDICVKTVRQVSTAVADGTIAAIKAFAFIANS